MVTAYAVTRSTALAEAVVICESKLDALELARRINYLGEEEDPEDYVCEVPLIKSELLAPPRNR